MEMLLIIFRLHCQALLIHLHALLLFLLLGRQSGTLSLFPLSQFLL